MLEKVVWAAVDAEWLVFVDSPNGEACFACTTFRID